MNGWGRGWLAGLIVVWGLASAFGAEGKLSGYMFGDFYWVAGHDNKAYKGENGFWFRRIYFTYDRELDPDFSTRLRLEMANPDFTATSDTMKPFIKDAFLKWKRADHALFFGLWASPTWELVESHWGYRSVEKTPLDLFKFGGSRDFGAGAMGKIGERLAYHVLAGNGSDTKSETDKQKKFYVSLSAEPATGLVVEAYGDFETGATKNTNKYTLQGFAGLKGDAGRAGFLFASQTRQQGVDNTGAEKPDLHLEIASVYGVLKVADKLNVYARADRMFDPSPATNSYVEFSTLAKPTLEYKASESVSVLPNVEAVFYEKTTGGAHLDPVVIPRLTLFYKF